MVERLDFLEVSGTVSREETDDAVSEEGREIDGFHEIDVYRE